MQKWVPVPKVPISIFRQTVSNSSFNLLAWFGAFSPSGLFSKCVLGLKYLHMYSVATACMTWKAVADDYYKHHRSSSIAHKKEAALVAHLCCWLLSHLITQTWYLLYQIICIQVPIWYSFCCWSSCDFPCMIHTCIVFRKERFSPGTLHCVFIERLSLSS